MIAFFKNTYLKGFSATKFIQLSYIAFKNYLVKTTSSATSLSRSASQFFSRINLKNKNFNLGSKYIKIDTGNLKTRHEMKILSSLRD